MDTQEPVPKMLQVLICHSIQRKAESAMMVMDGAGAVETQGGLMPTWPSWADYGIAESEMCECKNATEPTHSTSVRTSRFREAEKPADSMVSNIVLLESNSFFAPGF
ncbi:hypothetical protein N7510_008308 [Penicillium lagena]|uniref:uncharacterized protein n=1 Tax=Penicillium lagena TaxID=94218 RepID=UPI00254172F3|nr:uncharacterized protein N7510_008308 [Penicillium lagena]KAJ5605527.1 hypothetical protein N7510_008308 [Penicillium lagena]